MKSSISSGAAVLFLAMEICCTSRKIPATDVERPSVDAPKPASSLRLEVGAWEFDRPNGNRSIVFSFCFKNLANVKPALVQVLIDKVDAPSASCQLIASTGRSLSNNLVLRTASSGFSTPVCGTLAPGEYEISAIGRVGRATMRFSVSKEGKISRLPWDRFDKTDLSWRCPNGFNQNAEPTDGVLPSMPPTRFETDDVKGDLTGPVEGSETP